MKESVKLAELDFFEDVLGQYGATELIRNDPIQAIPTFMRDPETELNFVLCDMHKEWLTFIDDKGNRYILLIAPRGHGKTELCVIAYSAIQIGLNPNIRIKILSGSNDLAVKRVRAIKEIIEFNQDFIKIYGKLKPDKRVLWGDTKFTVTRTISGIKEPTLEAYGIESAGTGDRADLIILDDIINVKNALTHPSMREQIKTTFYGDITKWLSRKGRMIYVCTLWHQDDLSSELKRKVAANESRFKMKFYAIDNNFTPLWEEGCSRDKLIEEHMESPAEYDRAYRNMPISDEDAIFKRYWVDKCIRPNMTHDQFTDGQWKIYFGVDLAISKKSRADYTVIFILAVHPTLETRIPIGMIRGKFSSPETARAVLKANKIYKPDMVLVENNQYQGSLIEWIEDLRGTEDHPKEEWIREGWCMPNILGYRTGEQKHDPYEGLPSMANEFSVEKWIVPNHQNPIADGASPCSDQNCLCTWLDELISYPYGTKKDTVMASWLARMAAKTDLGFFIGSTRPKG